MQEKGEEEMIPGYYIPPEQSQELVYISGPMTKVEDFNRASFQHARRYAEQTGRTAIVPGVGEFYNANELETLTAEPDHREAWLRKDVNDILRCDSVWVLEGWENSRGSTFEVLIALELGIPVWTHHNGRVRRDDILWWATSAPWGDNTPYESRWV